MCLYLRPLNGTVLKNLDKYTIDIFRLNNKVHEYDFEVSDEFFEHFEGSYISKGELVVHVVLDKSDTMLTAGFSIKGKVELTCDRTLEKFEEPVYVKDRVIFKFGDEDREISDEIFMISRNTQRLELAQHIYDFIVLSLPMKKIHPRLREEDASFDEGDTVEGVLIYTSPADSASPVGNDPENDNQQDGPIDPRWEILKNLKNNNN
jgi:uncharacterized protein